MIRWLYFCILCMLLISCTINEPLVVQDTPVPTAISTPLIIQDTRIYKYNGCG